MKGYEGGGVRRATRKSVCANSHEERLTDCDALPELDEFLTQLGWGHLYRHCPDEDASVATAIPAPSPLPETRRDDRRLRTGGYLCWGAALLGLLFLGGVVAWPSVNGLLRQAAPLIPKGQADYRTSPFFSLAAFAKLAPGMTADDVRDRVGLPLARVTRKTYPGQQDWYYTAPGADKVGTFPFCVVTMEAGRVVRAKRVELSVKAGLSYGCIESATLSLSGPITGRTDEGPFVVGPAEAEITVLEGSNLPREPLMPSDVPLRRVRRIELDPMGRATVKAVVNGQAADLSLPSLSVCWAGTLYSLPHLEAGTPLEELEADLVWLLDRLHNMPSTQSRKTMASAAQ